MPYLKETVLPVENGVPGKPINVLFTHYAVEMMLVVFLTPILSEPLSWGEIYKVW